MTIEDRARLVMRADEVHSTDKAAMLIVLDATDEYRVVTVGDPVSMGVLKSEAIKLLKSDIQ